jgi:CheY-like chemotaxis protein
MKVGVVDDHDDTRYFMRCWLEGQCHEVQDWPRGRDLLSYLQQQELDLIIADLWLPDMDGLGIPELIRRIRKRDIPVVALTAHAMEGIREKALQAGFSEYVTKPVNLEILQQVIERVRPPLT